MDEVRGGVGDRVDPVERFFEELGGRDGGVTFGHVSGRVRFDVEDGSSTTSWSISIGRSGLTVERGGGAADCAVTGDRSVFESVVDGRANPIAAVLRGALRCDGDVGLLFPAQRIFPDPPRGWDPTAATRSA